jgi:hypothetical protein
MKIIEYIKGKKIYSPNNYSYVLTCNYGKDFDKNFNPYFSPMEMLQLGVFEGKYINDCKNEFPEEWYTKAKISKTPDPSLNLFKIKSRQSLKIWQEKGWIYPPDERGWFQWYCRYYIGRRIPEIDEIQIKRWKQFKRHYAQVEKNCKNDISCRPKQRQALLQWSYNCMI